MTSAKELVAHQTRGAPGGGGVELREGGLDGALHPSTVVALIHLQKQINRTIFLYKSTSVQIQIQIFM